MINALVGRPGGGKSYEAVRYHILPAILEDKRKVVTNIPINLEHIRTIHGQEYVDLIEIVEGKFDEFGSIRPFGQVEDFTKWNEWKNDKGQGPLFVVDESHLSIGRDAKKETLEYLSMHRHYGHDLLLLTQNERKLNRDVKDMVEVCFRCVKMEAFGDKNGYVRKTFHGLSDTRNDIHRELRNYEPEYFSYYQSHTMSKGSVQEAEAQGSKAVLNPYKKASTIMFVVGGLAMVFVFYRMFFREDTHQLKAKAAIETPQVQVQIIDEIVQKETSSIDHIQTRLQPEREKSHNEKLKEERERKSREYHPFAKVNLHIDGSYTDTHNGDVRYYFSASQNGQRIFGLSLRDLFMAGYDVKVFGECVVELTYFEYRDFLTCDVPKVSTGTSSITAKN